eukprot:271030_1
MSVGSRVKRSKSWVIAFILVVGFSFMSFIYDYHVFTDQQIYEMLPNLSRVPKSFNSITDAAAYYHHVNISNLIQTLNNNLSLFMSISNDRIEFCSPQLGVGNFLAHYWFTRSVSLFLNIDFKVRPKCKRFYRFFWKSFIPNLRDYVPNSKYQYIFNELHITYQDRINWIDMNINICKQHNKKLDYVFTNNMRLLYHNNLFQKHFVIDEINTAYTNWFKENWYNVTKQKYFNTSNDIVIYYRCGDIFSASGNNKDYGVLSLSFYEKAFQLIKTKLMKYEPTNSSITIWFITQFIQKNSFQKRHPKHCRNIIDNYIVPALMDIACIIFNRSKMNIKWIVRGNETNFNIDYYLLVTAPILICSDSSFCSTAALANGNKMIIMPYHSYLYQYNDVINSPSEYFHLSSNVENIEIDLQNGMELNSHKAVAQNMTLLQIVQFLFNHSLYANYSNYALKKLYMIEKRLNYKKKMSKKAF